MILKRLAVCLTAICLFFVSDNNPVYSQTENEAEAGMGLTLKDAIKIAQEEALKWNKRANLYHGLSVDNDEVPTGMDGRRKDWTFQFGIPNKTDLYLVFIRNGKVWKTLLVPDEIKKLPENYFITDTKKIAYDTPGLLKKGKKITNLYPGDLFAKGYNFGVSKDPNKNIPLVLVIGWDKPKKSMIYLMFNATNGELFNKIAREQYRN
jgi:hypothetical protein